MKLHLIRFYVFSFLPEKGKSNEGFLLGGGFPVLDLMLMLMRMLMFVGSDLDPCSTRTYFLGEKEGNGM